MIVQRTRGQEVLLGALASIRPLQARVLEYGRELSRGWRADAVVELSWEDSRAEFVVETKGVKGRIREAAEQALAYSQAVGLAPLIAVPHLSPRDLENLESMGVHGVDVSGNATVRFGTVLYRVSGREPAWSSPAGRSNPYRGATSLVLRALLEQPRFLSQEQIAEMARRLQPEPVRPALVKGTVAKAIAALEEDFVVKASRGEVRLVNVDGALKGLARNRPTRHPSVWRGASPLSDQEFASRLEEAGCVAMLTPSQAALIDGKLVGARERELIVSDLASAIRAAEGKESALFPNLLLIEGTEPSAFFAPRGGECFVLPSLLECGLALDQSGGRDAEAGAEYLRELRVRLGSIS